MKYQNLLFHLFIALAFITLPKPSSASEKPINLKCLIVLHGLARTSSSMSKVEDYFIQQNYLVWNKTYPSKKSKVELLSGIITEGLNFCKNKTSDEIFFVTHSMGGILVRHYFQQITDPQVKAVVMISPPNHGSEIVDEFKDQAWFKRYNGPAGLQMGTTPTSLPNTLNPIAIPVGVITGNVSSDPWFSHLFTGPNDGKVSVESAKLREMKDFLVVARGHTFIMNDDEVLKQTKNFFETLSFSR